MKRTKAPQWKNMLERRISELVSLTKDLSPEVEVTVLHPFEDEDAVIEIFAPPEKYDELAEVVGQRSTEILWDDGFFIVMLVHEKKNAPSFPVIGNR